MSLKADIQAIEPKKAGTKCAFLAFFDSNPDEIETVIAAMRNARYSSGNLSLVLTRNGLKASSESVRKHRNGYCSGCNEKGHDYAVR